LCSTDAQHVCLYVSASGDDNGTGTEAMPFNSAEVAVTKAIALLDGGDVETVKVIFSGGVYPVRRTIDVRGYKGRLEIMASDSSDVVFDGGVVVGGFSKVKKKNGGFIVAASLPDNVNIRPVVTDSFHLEVYRHGVRLVPARYPNKGFITTGKVDGYTLTKDNSYCEGIYKFTNPALCDIAGGNVYCHGFWCYDWSDSYQRIASVSRKDTTFVLSEPRHRFGYRKNARFYMLNSINFLDSIGEYYIEPSERKIYLFVSADAEISDISVELPATAADYMIRATDCTCFRIEGIIFRNGNGGIYIQGGKECEVNRCIFSQFAGDVVRIDGGRNHKFVNSVIENVGGRGIFASGGDRRDLVSSGILVDGNKFSNTSCYLYTYHSAVKFQGCGITISNNSFSDMPSSAIRVDGNDVLVTGNTFYDLVKVSNDQGAFDIHGNPSFRGIEICNNRWKNIGGGSLDKVAAVRLDDMISGVKVHDNYFENCGSDNFGAIQSFGGKDNLIYRNTFVGCTYAVSFSHYSVDWALKLRSEGMRKKIYEEVDISSELYLRRYPELREDIFLDEDHNYIYENTLIRCKHKFFNSDKNTIRDNVVR